MNTYRIIGTARFSKSGKSINIRIHDTEYYSIPISQLEAIGKGERLTAEVREYDTLPSQDETKE